MTSKANTIIHDSTGQALVTKLRHADSYFTRLRGLIGSPPLALQEGILISPCKQVHTHFMKYSIDVVFLDKHLTVINKIEAMPPWRVSSYVAVARYVLELPAYTAQDLEPADQLRLETR
ncbi:MAG: hypothetical protein CVU29_10595 [Betaproteobacteria bacterium HGW-Betaproteobacteria-22]|nr:MAG: hypothetical protein CVU29_10595 [Betaproteobacteria bacterium HGW-Betaproteobacteria-22]